MLKSFRQHWIAVLLLGMSACPLLAQSDPATDTPVTGATLIINGTTIGNTVNISPLLTLGTIVVPDSLPPASLSPSQPGALIFPGSNPLTVAGPVTGLAGMPLSSTSLTTGPLLLSGTTSTVILGSSTSLNVPTLTDYRTATIIGTNFTTNLLTTTSGNFTNAVTGGITLNTGTVLLNTSTAVVNATNLTLGNTLLSSNSGTVTLTGSSANLTISNGTLLLQNTAAITGNLDLQNTGNLTVQLPGTNSAGAVLTVAGDVTLSGNLTVVPGANLTLGSAVVIVNKTSAGAVTGTFTGRPQGSLFSANGREFIINYTGGDGNDVTLTAVSKHQAWRHAHFGTISNIGAAADHADADGDGIPNLIERACSLDPTAGSTLPVTTAVSGTNLEYNYVRSVAAVQAGDVFTVEWNDSISSTGWSSEGVTQQVQSDDGNVQAVKAVMPAGTSGHRFIRLRVTPAP
jgi:hypothetical protein